MTTYSNYTDSELEDEINSLEFIYLEMHRLGLTTRTGVAERASLAHGERSRRDADAEFVERVAEQIYQIYRADDPRSDIDWRYTSRETQNRYRKNARHLINIGAINKDWK